LLTNKAIDLIGQVQMMVFEERGFQHSETQDLKTSTLLRLVQTGTADCPVCGIELYRRLSSLRLVSAAV
jgi:hypothetical protein